MTALSFHLQQGWSMQACKLSRVTSVFRVLNIGSVVAVFCGVAALGSAHGQTFPQRPIKIIVAAGPGGPTDVPARLASQILPGKLGQPVVVENRPGGGGAIGARAVASSPADGYTLLAANTSVLAVLPAVSPNAGYDPTTSFAPVIKISESYQMLVVRPSSPWKSVEELVAYAKANPDKLNYAHTGSGGLPQLTGELFMWRAGVKLVGVPYRSGGEAVTAVLSEAVDATFESITILLPLIREGKLRALAITSSTRTPLAPDLPTMGEAGVSDYEVTTFNGIVAPAGTPAPIVQALNTALNQGLSTAEVQEQIGHLGAVSHSNSPAEFGAFIAGQFRKWSDVVKRAGVTLP
ncbi:MAG: Bug family tripartite tricarboxylate transporter substrate binding protein [Xanthobacteraceae bacterium]